MKTLIFFIFIPLGFACAIALAGPRSRRFAEAAANLAGLVMASFSLYLVQIVAAHKSVVYKIGGWSSSLGICLVADGLSALMLLLINCVSMLVMVYSVTYMNGYSDRWKFYALFMLLLAGLNGLALSGDMFNLYVFLELTSITAYILVAFGISPESLEASFKYAIMGTLASLFILLGIAFVYAHASTLNMAGIAAALTERPNPVLTGFVSVLFLAGFGLKAALVPFHAWLADAHSSAPSPVSALLSGVVIKTLGVYAIMRVFFNVLGVSDKLGLALMVLGSLSMILGALMAIAQNDIKRMFAYSSVSQVGYIIFALGINTPLAILGAVFHMLNHAIFKPLLFLNAGSIERATGTRELSRMGGLNKDLHFSGFAGLIGAMSISGVPPFGGFWSKLIIIIAALQSGHLAFAIIAVLVSIVTLAYYLKFQTFAFFGSPRQKHAQLKEASWFMKLAMFILVLGCVFSALLVIPGFGQLIDSAAQALLSGAYYKETVLGLSG